MAPADTREELRAGPGVGFLAVATLLLTALAFAFPAFGRAADPGPQTTNRIGMHSMLSPSTPRSAKEIMFREAAAVGASYIRVDLPLNGIFLRGDFFGKPLYLDDWSETDQFAQLAREHGLKVLAVLHGTPWYIADCAPGTAEIDAHLCPPGDLRHYREMVAKVAGRYAGVIDEFEIINEPDNPRYFWGDAAQYARTLSAAADAIHDANPKARVAIGGVTSVDSTEFTDAVLAAEPSLTSKVDINSIHLRSSAAGTAKLTEAWRRYFSSRGMNGPLWLTEYGYPADPAFQNDRLFTGGEQAQADFLRTSMPWVVGAGAEMLFVTQRDWGLGAFASEGILESPDPLTANPAVRRRAAFEVVRAAASSLKAGFPPGRSVYSQPRRSKVKLRARTVPIRFSCVSAGDCPARSVRMKLRGGGTMRVATALIPSGSHSHARPRLSMTAAKLVKRAGRRGVRATVTDFTGNVLGTFTVVR